MYRYTRPQMKIWRDTIIPECISSKFILNYKHCLSKQMDIIEKVSYQIKQLYIRICHDFYYFSSPLTCILKIFRSTRPSPRCSNSFLCPQYSLKLMLSLSVKTRKLYVKLWQLYCHRENEQYINTFLGLRNNENLLYGSNKYEFVVHV